MPARARGSRLHSREPSHARSRPDLVLEGRILHRGRIVRAEVGISDEGRIVAVAPHVPGGRRRDLGDALLLPSATDVHVHFRDPGPEGSVDSFPTGTLQAALGGVGAVVDMPNTEPPTTSLSRLEAKESRVRGRSHVDVLLLSALLPDTPVEVLAGRTSGFKLYLAPTTGDLVFPSERPVAPLLQRAAAADSAVHVHAELPRSFVPRSVPQDPQGWDAARPSQSEHDAVSALCPPPPHLRLHIAHATTAETVELASQVGASTEATPHHLLLSDRDLRDARGKVNPPLRRPTDRAKLFQLFRDGKVSFLASDHAPHALAAKEKPFPEAPSGMPGVETMLPLLLSRVRAGELSLSTLVRAACRRPALFLGLRRGVLRPGAEANLIVVDFRSRRQVAAKELHAPCGWSAFEGLEAIFPREHYHLGRRIVEDGEFIGTPTGRLLRRVPERTRE